MPQSASEPLDVLMLSSSPTPKCDLVFVHGLMGSPEDTWRVGDQYWPSWLASYGDIWILRYPADLLWWSSSGASMAIPDRARSVIDLLVSAGIGQTRPVIFVTHSLGGLLVKAILRLANDFVDSDWKKLLSNTRGVVFLATPHRGSHIASIANLGKILGISVNATQLTSNDPYLRDLSSWYTNNAKRYGIKTYAYYETLPTHGLVIVDPASADPGVDDCTAIPADYNHINICKFAANHHPVYGGILRFIESIVGPPHSFLNRQDSDNAPEYSVDTVFGMRRGDTHHYIQRLGVDNAFITHLIGDRHLCIYGSSKQGKTALRKKHISDSQCLVVVCDRSWTSTDVFAALLRTAGYQIERDASAPNKCLVRLPGSGDTKINVDLNDAQDFIGVLEARFKGRYLIIEEFHYLSEESQRDIAYKLKALHEVTRHYLFIVVGVWLESNRLVHLNGDLVGRVSPINADMWADDDLIHVITEGERKLNIRFPTGFAAKLVAKSCGSVYLVREACRRACEIVGVYGRVEITRPIDQTLNVRAILKEVASDGIDYQGQLLSMFAISANEVYAVEQEQNLKEWVLRALVCSTGADMRKGITVRKLRSLIQQKHPQHYHPSEGQIERMLKAMLSRHLAAGQSLFDYDRQEKCVRCVDKGFILWRMGTNEDRIEHLIAEGEAV